jgi:tRNA-dihydrouridine synthase
MRESAKLCAELGFDGVDINMGCPDKSIEKQGAGACMIKNPESARAVINSAREGVRDAGKNIPLSVKTRIGYNKIDLDWIKILLAEKLDALTVHLRTRKEMSDVPAHWDIMTDIVKLRDEIAPDTLIIGNGDVRNIKEGRDLCMKYGCDGIMFGRAIFGNPWLFNESSPLLPMPEGEVGRGWEERKLHVLIEHVKLFEEILGGKKNFAIMKKHFKAYVNGFDGAKELRIKLMEEGDTASDVERVIVEYLTNSSKCV